MKPTLGWRIVFWFHAWCMKHHRFWEMDEKGYALWGNRRRVGGLVTTVGYRASLYRVIVRAILWITGNVSGGRFPAIRRCLRAASNRPR